MRDPLSLDVGYVDRAVQVLRAAADDYYEHVGGREASLNLPHIRQWAIAADVLEEAANKIERALKRLRKEHPLRER